jgi:putative ABC transport system permease protein
MVTCGASIWNMISAPIPPEVNKERTFFLNFKSNSNKERTNVTELNLLMEISGKFLNQDIYHFKTPELITVYNNQSMITEIIRNNKTKTIGIMRTDINFFKVFEFVFVAGKPYSISDISDETYRACVISEKFAKYYFGGINCLGQIITDRDRQYKVVGIVKKPATATTVKSDLYFLSNPQELAIMGLWMCNVVVLCHSKEDKNELDAELKKWTYKNENGQLSLSSETTEKQYLTQKIGFEWELMPLYCVMVFIALVIPILCLIDILKNNQTFRNEELAIRRAFGAPQKKIIFLLLFDNLFITILAGVLGLVFSFLFFAVLSNESLSNLFLVFFNWRAFFYYTAIFLIIGAIAGIVPALNLSKHQIVNALYATNND